MSISVADRRADLLEGQQSALQVGGGNILAVGFLGRRVERPDLHRRDPLRQKVGGELAGAVEERVEVVVAVLCAQAPIARVLALGGAHVGRAGAGVVGADARPREAAEKLRDRLPRRLAEQVPQRDVERRVAADLGAGGAEPDIEGQVLGDPVDGERIAAEELWRDRLVHIGFNGLRQEERLAEADQPLVRVDAEPQEVGEFFEPDRFDGGDLHGFRLS